MNDQNILYHSNFIGSRITELRFNMKPIPSEREISLSIGQNVSYITKITAGKTNPTIDKLYSICEYFGITPAEFFNPNEDNPAKDRQVITHLKSLAGDDFHVLTDFILSLDKESIYFILKIINNYNMKGSDQP